MTVDRSTGGRGADARSASTGTAGAGVTGAGARGLGARGSGLPPITPRPVSRPTPEEVDRHGDELFKKSIADLSRRLEERAQQASDPRAAAELRRAALLAYNAARARRLKLLAGAGGASVAVACIAWFVVAISNIASEPDATASAAPTPSATKIETASAAAPVATTAPSPTPPQPDVTPPSTEPPPAAAVTPPASPSTATPGAPPPAASTPAAPEPKVVPTTVASINDPAPSAPPAAPPVTSAPMPPAAAAPAPAPAPAPTPAPASAAAAPAIPAEVPLQRTEINEIQTRLYTFGFNPGPIDGAPGPMTQVAAMRYRAERGLPQTDAINRELLEALRQDPAPQVAQAPPPPRPAPQRAYYTQRRSNDPFESLRIAGDKFGRWLQSLGNN